MQDVISAFLDNEPFDREQLSAALSTEDGRRLLLDLVALRSVVQPALTTAFDPAIAAARPGWHWAAAAAVLMLTAGFALGQWAARSPDPPSAVSTVVAPEPTAAFKFEPGVNWRETPPTGGG